MDLVVHSDRARDLAETLSKRMGRSVSEVVETALEEKLASVPPAALQLTPEEKMRRIDEILRRSGPTPPGATSDHSDLYDEEGLPA